MKICPNCAAENADTAKFCNECGTAFEIEKTESVETTPIPDTQCAPVDLKEDVKPSPAAEATTDNQNLEDDYNENVHENTEAQISNSEISQPEMKKTIKLKIWQKVLIAIVAVLAILIFRPRMTNVSIGYKGDTTAGTVLDDNNPGFYATGTTNYGKQIEIPYTDLRIKEPKTLEADSSETVTVYFKNAHTDLTIDCTTTALKSLSAQYNGSTYEGTTINKQSDIAVTATYGDGHTQDIPYWYLKPESVILKKGEESKVEVCADFEDGTTLSTVLSITGTEKPFTRPEIEGDHYNCTIDQFVKYVKESTNMSLFEMNKLFGDEYECYGIVPPREVSEISKDDAMVLALRENEDGKLWNIAIWAADKTTGMATSLQYAKIVDWKFNANDETQKENFVTKNYYASGDIAIIINEENGAYIFMILNHDQAKDAVDKLGGNIP